MRRLPRLSLGSHVWHLPLADGLALLLERALLESSADGRFAQLASALGEDPALTLWAVCQAHQLGGRQLITIRAVADWFLEHGFRLDWSVVGGECPPAGILTVGRFAELAARGVAVAERCRSLAAEEDALDPEHAYLAGLLHGVEEWLRLAAAGPPIDAETIAFCLPEWLAHVLRDMRGAPVTLAGACVIQALAMVDGCAAADQPAERRLLDAEVFAERQGELLRRWLMVDENVSWRLAALLARLRELECRGEEFRRALETEKLDALKELAYGASHEINNPLANISARAQMLLRDERDPQRRRMLSSIHAQALRAHEMIADLMLYARPPKLVRKCVNLVQLVDDAVTELCEHAARQDATIERQGMRQPVMVVADEVQLGVVLRAMGTNALDAISTGGHVHLEVRVDEAAGATCWARVIVADNGPGISPRVRRHLFDPFFSGREAGRGLGFGLSKCWRIVTDHGGRIDVDSPPDGGAIFTVSLPIDRRP